MGGNQTLNIAIPHLDKFAYIGVFSSGLIGSFGPRPNPAATGAAAAPPGLWFSTGKEDRLLPTTTATVEMLKKHGFNAEFEESPGAHTWINWRNYLNEFAPRLFQ